MSKYKKKIEISAIEKTITTLGILNRAEHIDNNDIKLDFPTLSEEFNNNLTSIANGDLKTVEEALYSQSVILQDYFNRILQLASIAKSLDHIKILGDLALKAQNQCRTTLSTLADIKHPRRTMFIGQQNNAIQQINNNQKKIENPTSLKIELLKDIANETLEPRRTSEAIAINPHVEALETIHGS